MPCGVCAAGKLRAAARADRVDGCLVDEVREVGSGEAGGGTRYDVPVDVGSERLGLGVDGEDRCPLGLVGQGDGHVPVEASGPEKRGVEGFGPVGRGEYATVLTWPASSGPAPLTPQPWPDTRQ